MDPDAFEATQRQREWFHSLTIPTGLWTVLRVDGRGFSKLTEARFAKPFDERFRDHMLAAATALMTDFDAAYGYTESDEISIVLTPAFDKFGRSLEKLVSISAGVASAAFTAAAGSPAHFDSRVWIAATLDEVVDYFSWRQSDAARSALNNWCYWTLRNAGGTAREATKALDSLGTSAKNELLFSHGINFNDVPFWQRRGIGLSGEDQEHVGIDPRTGAEIPTTRRRLRADHDLPIKDAYRSMLTAALGSAYDPRPARRATTGTAGHEPALRLDDADKVDLLPFLVRLEQPYDPEAPPPVDLADLLRFAFSVSDYWTDRALEWLEFGCPAEPVRDDLKALVDESHRPQPLRHRALRILKNNGLLSLDPPSELV